jgi:glycerophosphoryl diester phosphodiesterase
MVSKKGVLNLAHRGFSGKYPENTEELMRFCINLGVDSIISNFPDLLTKVLEE